MSRENPLRPGDKPRREYEGGLTHELGFAIRPPPEWQQDISNKVIQEELYRLLKSEGVFDELWGDRVPSFQERVEFADELIRGHFSEFWQARSAAFHLIDWMHENSIAKRWCVLIREVTFQMDHPDPSARGDRYNPDDYEDDDIEIPPDMRAALSPEIMQRIEGELVPGGMWVEWDRYYGCGAFGCVWPLLKTNTKDKSGIALKITSDLTEGPTVAAIIESKLDKQLNGLVRFYDIRRLPTDRHTWAFSREDILPMDHAKDEENQIHYAPWFPLLEQYTNIARQMLPDSIRDLLRVYPKKVSRLGAIDLGQDLRAQMDEVLNEMNEYPELEWIVQALDSLRDFNIVLADLHPGNVGWRVFQPQKLSLAGRTHDFSSPQQPMPRVDWFDGVERPPLLIFDVGVASAPAGTAIKELSREALRENPVLDAAYDWIPVLK